MENKHKTLVELGKKWMKARGFGVIVTEFKACGCEEQPDVFGLRANCSVLIEAKTSRADFHADKKKPHRKSTGIGTYRFYLSPTGIITPDDIPQGWGLLWAEGKTVVSIIAPHGNIWPSYGASIEGWTSFQHVSDMESERNLLYSVLRRKSEIQT